MPSLLTRTGPAAVLAPTLRGYRRSWARPDLVAGLTVAALLVPQAMAYAQTAGMPPVTGLYASVLPVVVFALLSTSRYVAVGPNAVIAVMVPEVVGPLVADGDPVRYVALSGALSILVGVICLVAGAARLGFVANFLSVSVLLGYISGSAMIIAASQLGPALGIPVTGEAFFDRLASAVAGFDDIHPATATIAAATVLLMLVGPATLGRLRPGLPWALVAVVAGVVASRALDLAGRGVATVGDFPRGLGPIDVPAVSYGDVTQMLPGATGIALVAYVQTVAVASQYATAHRETIHPNRELVALGGANVTAGLVQGFVINGSLTRTAVDEQAGGRSQAASLISAGVVAAVLVAFAPLVSPLPSAVLAGIVIVTAARLVDVARWRTILGVSREEAGMAVLALVGTLVLGVTAGLFLAVVASLVALVSRATRPHTAVLGFVPSQGAYRDVERYPDARLEPDLVLYRFDGALFFANVGFFREQVLRLATTRDPPARCVVLDAEAITHIDLSAAEALVEVRRRLAEQGVEVLVTRAKSPLYERMRRFGVVDAIGPAQFFATNHAAVDAWRRRAGPSP